MSIAKTRDDLFRLAEMADREGLDDLKEKIMAIAEEAEKITGISVSQNLSELHVPA
ncbi:MAG: hypothetical protein WCX23_03425 [Candidatus Paceibacterota bacterium]|jgi:hypothetical protein|nr:hypothetical protein [Candidatus Paceibacterota bacterium]MDD4830719.1 hypothetical protein [Candidatus Paceibacterota bacterium]MDD4875131.1 hypothetical protein [Candidatus Paceibacterota bacterium]